MSKIYFISDSHMSYLIYANRQGINKDTYRALLSTARYIVDDPEEDKTVVFCGDNFDSKSPCPSDIAAFQDAVNILTEAGIPVYGIEGNHDKVAARRAAAEDDPEDLSQPYDGVQWLDLVTGIKSISHKTVKIKSGLTIHGLDYIQGKQIYEELDNVPECDILVLHQPFAHVSPFEANLLEVEGVPDQIRKAVVFGHVHISDKRKTSNGVHVVSPGATHSQKLTHPHGAFAVYEVKNNEFCFVETPEHRDMHRFVCNHESDIEEIEEELHKYKSEEDRLKPIIGIKYKEILGNQIAKLVNKYEDKIHLFPHVVPSDIEQATSDEVKDLSEAEILDVLFDSLDLDRLGEDKELYENALSIVEGNSAKVFENISKMENERDEINKTGVE